VSRENFVGRILLIGAGGHARSCIDVIENAGLEIAGLIGQPHEVGSSVFRYTVLGVDHDLPTLVRESPSALITVGQIETPVVRIRLYERLREIGFNMPTVISPLAYVSPHAQIGEGTIIMHGAVVNAGAIVGSNCIINSQALVEHDACVGDHCHISTRGVLNGGVCVGRGTFVGSGAVVRHEVTIGDYCVIGMGSVVRKSHPDHARVVGNE